MCPEDRAFIAEKKSQEREEDGKRHAAEEKRRAEERRKEKEEEGADSLEKLRLKIKFLQVISDYSRVLDWIYIAFTSHLHTYLFS